MRFYPPRERTIGAVLADKAARIGERPLVHWEGQALTYADAEAATNRYARGFAELGITRGAKVAVMLPNCPEFLWIIWGLGKLGAIAVPLNTAAKGEQLSYFLRQSDSEWLCTDAASLPRFTGALREVEAIKGILALGGDASDDLGSSFAGRRIEELSEFTGLPSGPLDLDYSVEAHDPHLIMYTSGTTGPSKGAVCPHSQGLAVGRQMAEHTGYRDSDILYTCLPLFHGNALWYTVYAALWAEASVALYPRFSARSFWDEIRESRATVFNALGAMANIIWQMPPSPRDRDHAVRTCMLVPTSQDLVEGFAERYGIAVTSVYAATENCAVTVYGPDDPRSKAPSAGRVRDYMAVEIVDEDGYPLPANEVGQIRIRPNEPGSIMTGYYNMPEATVASTRDLWFHSGDRGFLDEDGYLFFVERAKESIRRRGENISAFEIESILCKHEHIVEAAAVPVPSELSEDDVAVYIVSKPGSSPQLEELVQYCVDNMAYFMVPRYWAVVDELPKTASQKIEKYKLKTTAATDRGSLWDRESAGLRISRDS